MSGQETTVRVPAEAAHGAADPRRIHRWHRKRFPSHAVLEAGTRALATDSKGRRRLVRIVEVKGDMVLVDTNHRWAGQALLIQVKLLTIHQPEAPFLNDALGG
jgi:FKBP-type peptidyl-prolyl cis-trans isomerase 2